MYISVRSKANWRMVVEGKIVFLTRPMNLLTSYKKPGVEHFSVMEGK